MICPPVRVPVFMEFDVEAEAGPLDPLSGEVELRIRVKPGWRVVEEDGTVLVSHEGSEDAD